MNLKALQVSADNNTYSFDTVNPELLETFSSPLNPGYLDVSILIPEFTSLCPITKQPDFAQLEIAYRPNELCIESKSLKLYLMGYRNSGMFHEACVSLIADHLISILDPEKLIITGKFTPRGGISFWPTVTYERHTSLHIRTRGEA